MSTAETSTRKVRPSTVTTITPTIYNGAEIADGVTIGSECVIQREARIESRFDVLWATHPDGTTWTLYPTHSGSWVCIESELVAGKPAFKAGVATYGDDQFPHTPHGVVAQYLDFKRFDPKDPEKRGFSSLTPTEIETVTELGEQLTELRRLMPHPDQLTFDV